MWVEIPILTLCVRGTDLEIHPAFLTRSFLTGSGRQNYFFSYREIILPKIQFILVLSKKYQSAGLSFPTLPAMLFPC